MIGKKVQEAINEQINAELYSAYLYLSMQAWFESMNLPGFANWMHVQTLEETTHAMKFYAFLNDRSGKVALKAVAKPPAGWKSPLDVFEATYEHEQKVTGLINNLVVLAMKEKDHATAAFLQWFVNEQVEEEKNADTIAGKLRLIKGSAEAIYMLDKELATRVFTPPAPAAKGA